MNDNNARMSLKYDKDKEELIVSSNKEGFAEEHIFLNVLEEKELEDILKKNARLIMSLRDNKKE